MNDRLADLLGDGEAELLATGFEFTEGPLWHPEGFYSFSDIRANRVYRLTPGGLPEVMRERTAGANGRTFDLQGRIVMCEGEGRRVVRIETDGTLTLLADRFEGKRLNRPNDVICSSDGSIYFTDPAIRVPPEDRELPFAAVFRIAPDGGLSLVAECEYPNGLAFSPDERILYVANTRWAQYIHALEMAVDGTMRSRRIFANMSSEDTDGVPDGMKVDVQGRVYCTGPGGTWVFEADGRQRGIIRTPEVPANVSFGGADLRTLFLTARTSVYALRLTVPGLPHPWYLVQNG